MIRAGSRIAILALLVPLVLAGCEKVIDVHARVTDAQGRGIPGAVFYCEAWQYNNGAYDFSWGLADSTGMVKSTGGQPLTIRWRSGAKLGVAVMAPGKRAFAFNDYADALKPADMEFALDDLSDTLMKWEPKLAKLSFPFEKESGLAERLRDSTSLPLLEGFAVEYGYLSGGQFSATSEETEKLAFLNKLIQEARRE